MVDKKDQYNQIIQTVKDAIACDQQLRDENLVGDKFRFIRDRLHALLEQLEKNIGVTEEKEKLTQVGFSEDEKPVYVYLFNAHGLDLRSWSKMLTPQGFHEYSVNRPIYFERLGIDTFIRGKQNKLQHAFLIIVLHKNDILSLESGKDSAGHSLIKVKEGSLRFEKLISFFYNDQEYTVRESGELIKKSVP